MKLDKNILVIVAMVVGAAGATGCKSQEKITDKGNDVAAAEKSSVAIAEDDPNAAAVEEKENTSPGVEKDWVGYRSWAYRAPPAYRYEPVGAYRAGHFWRPGYYGWNGSDYNWNGGAYYPERVGYRYVNPSWYGVGSRWGYRRGYWVRH
jgi:hypothetical protein